MELDEIHQQRETIFENLSSSQIISHNLYQILSFYKKNSHCACINTVNWAVKYTIIYLVVFVVFLSLFKHTLGFDYRFRIFNIIFMENGNVNIVGIA